MSFAKWFRCSAALAVIAAAAVFCAQASAVTDISTWTFESGTAGNPPGGAGCTTTTGGTCPVGSDISGISSTTGPGAALGHHASSATVWSNPAGNGSAESWSANNYGIGDYFQFQSSTTGFSDIGLYFDSTGSGTGPKDWRVQYSTNGTTFIDSGITYSLTPETWTSGGTPQVASARGIDLRSVPALNNATDVYFRLVVDSTSSVGGGTISTAGSGRIDNFRVVSGFVPLEPPPPPPTPRLPQGGDVVFGLNNGVAANTFELVNGPATAGGGVVSGTPWQSTTNIEGVKFDNYNGQLHNAHGNLLGLNFSNGQIYSFATQGSIPATAGQLIGDPGATASPGVNTDLTASALGSVSVSPNNQHIAVMAAGSASSPGEVYVYDYTPGDAHGAGAALTNARATSPLPIPVGSSQGTAWIDNNTVAVFAATGGILTINATDMSTIGAFPVTVPSAASPQTALAYNPDVSPYVWALFSNFTSPTNTGRLYVLDPANNFSLVQPEINLDTQLNAGPTSGDTPRDLALDAAGNLYISGFGSTIDIIPNAAANATGTIDPSTLFRWYKSNTFSSFNGLDIGFAAGVPGDFNNDGKVDAADYVTWRKNGTANASLPNDNGLTNQAARYTLWRSNFGNPAGAGSSLGRAAVPEPASAVLLLIGLAAFCSRLRKG